jgi:spermidine/putrescine transport system permease protein
MTVAAEKTARRRRNRGVRVLASYAYLYLAFLYLPVLFLPLFSFNNSVFVTFPLTGFTLKWYEQMFANQEMQNALWASLEVGAIASISATILGLLAAKAVTRYAVPGKDAITGFIMIPLFIPEIILGISLLILFSILDTPLSLLTVAFAHTLLTVPFALAVLLSRFDGFDKSLEEASLDLGESGWMTFWRVTFPLVMPGVISSLLLSFIVSFDDFLIAFFVSGTQPTLPVFIWSQLRFPARLPGVLALGALILVASCVLVVFAEWMRRRGVSDEHQHVGVA